MSTRASTKDTCRSDVSFLWLALDSFTEGQCAEQLPQSARKI